MFIDDYKAGIVEPEKVVRIIQNSANSQGRARLNPGAGYKISPARGVRGLILSTGEDFVSNVESVTGRTILLSVEPDQNLEAGAICWRRRNEYRRLIPGLLEWLLARDDWPDQMENKVAQVSEALRARVAHSSHGTRLLNNWGLNAFGFELFVRYSRDLSVIEDSQRERLLEEYQAIMMNHIADHTDRLQLQEPAEIFFRVLGEKFATSSVRVQGFHNQKSGKMIGTVRDNGNILCLFPDTTLEVITAHFRSLAQRVPFTKETLRDALVREGLIIRSGPGRVTHQVRVGESRLQAWQFDAAQFRMRCGLRDI